MKKTTVIIPNYNGIKYLENCLRSLTEEADGKAPDGNGKRQRLFDILVIDNGSGDGSEHVAEQFDGVSQIRFEHNTGFCGAVNAGIRAAATPYVLLLNNDTEVRPGFVEKMTEALEENEKAFSVSAKLLSMKEPELVDDAGDYYCALGWAFARGKGKPAADYEKEAEVFAACAGAAIYRRELVEELGLFDENHFAYLEDIDIAYRARIRGYRNYYTPAAKALHAGSATTGSAHNPFKVRLSAKNSVYLVYKNMPFLQFLLNLPFLAAGHFIKYLYFCKKGLGGDYRRGFAEGLSLCHSKEGRARKVKFCVKYLDNYVKIQMFLWINMVRRLAG